VSDFHQHGLISTLQRLTETNAESIEAELATLTEQKPVSLVMPCHSADVGNPALAHIIGELAQAKFIREIIFSMNGMDEAGFQVARNFFSRVRIPHRILWNDGPGLGAVYRLLSDVTHLLPPPGKGFNVWAAFGLGIAEGKSELIVTQDCDVASFQRSALALLCYAALHPDLSYHCSKMYYSRVTDRIYGRVSRLFLTPLLHALVRVLGHHPLLDFLLSFRYPLSGEYALRREVADALSFRGDWGLEIGLLCEIFRATEPGRVCQVDGGGNYDHRHQPLEAADGGGLHAMSKQIAAALFEHLAGEGAVTGGNFLPALQLSYRRESRDALRRYGHLALMNGISFDAVAEQRAVDSFSRALEEASTPSSVPRSILPSWRHIAKVMPDFAPRFLAAVAEENEPSGK